jgi:hypothetical protein
LAGLKCTPFTESAANTTRGAFRVATRLVVTPVRKWAPEAWYWSTCMSMAGF